MGDEVLAINDLHVSVEGNEIIKGISLSINLGEVHVIMGRNGAGKSTLANVIMGHPAYEVTSGNITYNGKDFWMRWKFSREQEQECFYLPIPLFNPRRASRNIPKKVSLSSKN